MYKIIKISKSDRFEAYEMTELGSINIICGKNNSGKSTLLNEIQSLQNISIGKQVTNSDAEYIYNETISKMHWNIDSQNVRDSYKRIINNATSGIWYSNDANRFIEHLEDQKNNNYNSRMLDIPTDALKSAFKSIILGNENIVLIPAKRQLENIVSISTGSEVQPDGREVINKLFYLQNQPDSSEENTAFLKINEAFEHISDGYKFNITPNQHNSIQLQFNLKNNIWHNSKDCGLGLQDLLIILFFAIASDKTIILLEEPENHMHPGMQKKLLYFLQDNSKDKQYFISTHSNVFVNNSFVDRVFLTSYINGLISIKDTTSRSDALQNIGYSVTDNLIADLVILVEGPSDIPVLSQFLIKMGIYDKYDIKMWPLGGDIMDQVDISILSESHKTIALIDGDPYSTHNRNKFREKCDKLGVECFKLKRYAIENYFTIDAIRSNVPNAPIPDNMQIIDTNKKLEEQIGWNVKKNNLAITKTMSLDDIKNTDLFEFLSRISDLCADQI